MVWRGVRAMLVGMALFGCSGGGEPAAPPAPPPLSASPHPALLVVQAWFELDGRRPIPQPAKLTILRTDGARWEAETLLDPESNVFHKAVPWRDGILTIGGTKARLVHWKRASDGWQGEVLWERAWGGDFDRMRDLGLGDVNGDGREDIVLATHDQGVVAVGVEGPDGWTFTEIDAKPDTFVHEIELGDLDGDGRLEIYATPSDKNRASLVSQPGGVSRYVWDVDAGAWTRTQVAAWASSHAKEILVTDLGTGKDRLYAVREAQTEKTPTGVRRVDPVQIVRLDPQPDGTFSQTTVASLEDTQCRFLVAADLNGDGRVQLVAAAMKSGLYVLEPNEDGTFTPNLIDAASSGFEHAVHVADLDGDGRPEIYVAADDQGKLRRYEWDGATYARTEIADIPKLHLTWGITHGTL